MGYALVVTGTPIWRTTRIYVSTHPIQHEKCQACDDDIWFCVPSDEYFHPLRSTEQAKVDHIMGEAGLADTAVTQWFWKLFILIHHCDGQR